MRLEIGLESRNIFKVDFSSLNGGMFGVASSLNIRGTTSADFET